MCADVWPTLPCENLMHTDYLMDPHYRFGSDSGGFGVLDNYGSTWEVTNYYESSYYLESAKTCFQWYKEGYFNHLKYEEEAVKKGDVFGICLVVRPDSQKAVSEEYGRDMTIFSFKEDMLETPCKLGYGIPVTAGDYFQAARLLNFIYSNRAFNDTLNWGVEGLDWVDKGDNKAGFPTGVTLENCGYHNDLGWLYPNQRIAHVWEDNASDYFGETVKKAEAEAHKSVAYGFLFDEHLDSTFYSVSNPPPSPTIEDRIRTLANIKDHFGYEIDHLSFRDDPDPEAMIQNLNQQLYEAGLEDVMKEKQRQLNVWRGN